MKTAYYITFTGSNFEQQLFKVDGTVHFFETLREAEFSAQNMRHKGTRSVLVCRVI